MGGACSNSSDAAAAEEAKMSQAIDRALRSDRMEMKRTFKLLLLGGGESGKSTFFKQLKLLNNKINKEEKEFFKDTLRRNCIQLMQAILDALPLAELELAAENKEHAAFISGLEGELGDEKDYPQVVKAMKALWADPACPATYDKRGTNYQLNDSSDYLFENVERIFAKDYFPSEQDIVRARIRTTGVEEADFEVGENRFIVIDVGGQRSERRKWVHCFEGVTSVIYFVAMNEYDMKLREDDTNRMHDSIGLYGGICTSPWFTKVPIILMLNKMDLFKEKIKTVNLQVCFPEYSGSNDWKEAAKYVKKRFKEKSANHTIKIHLFVAVDADNVKVVFEAVKEGLLAKHMEQLME